MPSRGRQPSSFLDILKELLAAERTRLETALRIEAERRIVFPETTVIIRDIQKLIGEIARREGRDDIQPNAFDLDLEAFNGFELETTT